VTTVRAATSADFYAFARVELAHARLAVQMIKVVEESSREWENPFREEVRRAGLDLIVDALVRADAWREHARSARRQGL